MRSRTLPTAFLALTSLVTLACNRSTGGAPPTTQRMDLPSIRAAMAAIKPLHSKKAPPQPGDWLLSHDEPGQTFDEYRGTDPNRPTAGRTTIYVQPLGEFTQLESKLIDDASDILARYFALHVKKLPGIPLSVIPHKARRVHPTWGGKQILSTYILDMLQEKRPKDAVALIALTNSDLWPGEGWNFVFGQAMLTERVGVWSLHRFGDAQKDYTLVLRRTCQTAVHETGHMFGIQHCIAYECCMNGSNNLPESDRAPLAMCPECDAKILWSCGGNAAARYETLAAFASEHNLKADAAFWQKCLAALKQRP